MGKQAPAPSNYKGSGGQSGGSQSGLGQTIWNWDSALSGAPGSQDYRGAAEAQAQSSQGNVNSQTSANRPDQNSPFASSGWTQGPDGKWTQNTSLNGGLNDFLQSLLGQAGQNTTPMDWSQFGELDDGSAARDQAIDASYNQSTRRLNPQWNQREEQMRSQLANSGLDPNSEAYRNASRELNTNRNDAYATAMSEAIRGGAAAQSATFNQNLQARQQKIMEALKARGLPVEELQGLFGFTAQPGFNAAGAADPTQFLAAAGMQGNFDLQKWAQQMGVSAEAVQSLMDLFGKMAGGAGGALAGGAGAGGAALGALGGLSDERAKMNIERTGKMAIPGVPFVTFVYKPEHDPFGRRRVGVLAQDLEKVAPEYVSEREDGLKVVDYSFLKNRDDE